MKINKPQFIDAASQVGISSEKIEAFWKKLEETQPSVLPQYLFYFGAMLILSTMLWFMSVGFELFGAKGIFFLALIYAIIFVLLGHQLWQKQLKIPAGLLITLAVCMGSLALYSFMVIYNLWPGEAFYDFSLNRRIVIQIGTIFLGSIALYFYPFHFLIVPILLSAWLLVNDLLLFWRADYTWKQESWVSLFFGLALIVLSLFLERYKKREFAFWTILFGTIIFWIGLNGVAWDSAGAMFIYLLVNLAMILFYFLIRRNVLMIFGTLGVFLYLTYLAYDIFENNILFPFALTIIGLAIIYIGIQLQKNADRIEAALIKILPKKMRSFFVK